MHPALARPCVQHPAAAAAALSREGVSELLLAALQLELDPSANQLQEQLDAGEARSSPRSWTGTRAGPTRAAPADFGHRAGCRAACLAVQGRAGPCGGRRGLLGPAAAAARVGQPWAYPRMHDAACQAVHAPPSPPQPWRSCWMLWTPQTGSASCPSWRSGWLTWAPRTRRASRHGCQLCTAHALGLRTRAMALRGVGMRSTSCLVNCLPFHTAATTAPGPAGAPAQHLIPPCPPRLRCRSCSASCPRSRPAAWLCSSLAPLSCLSDCCLRGTSLLASLRSTGAIPRRSTWPQSLLHSPGGCWVRCGGKSSQVKGLCKHGRGSWLVLTAGRQPVLLTVHAQTAEPLTVVAFRPACSRLSPSVPWLPTPCARARFNDPKALVAGAASGEAQAPRGGYSIGAAALLGTGGRWQQACREGHLRMQGPASVQHAFCQ